jgi:hypothetical protein
LQVAGHRFGFSYNLTSILQYSDEKDVSERLLLRYSILGTPTSRRLLCRRDGGAPRGSALSVGSTAGGLDAERAKLLINKTFRHFMALYYATHYRGFALLTPGYLAFAASRF